MPPAAGRNAELLLWPGSLREEQASSEGVIIIRCGGPLPRAVRGPFLGWLQPVVPSSEACGPGRTYREAIPDPAETCPARGHCRGKGTAPHLSFWTLRASACYATELMYWFEELWNESLRLCGKQKSGVVRPLARGRCAGRRRGETRREVGDRRDEAAVPDEATRSAQP